MHNPAYSASIEKFSTSTRSRRIVCDQSREEVKALIRAAFPGASNAEIARKAHEATGTSQRQIINYLNGDNDAPYHFVRECMMHAARQSDPDLPVWVLGTLNTFTSVVGRFANWVETRK